MHSGLLHPVGSKLWSWWSTLCVPKIVISRAFGLASSLRGRFDVVSFIGYWHFFSWVIEEWDFDAHDYCSEDCAEKTYALKSLREYSQKQSTTHGVEQALNLHHGARWSCQPVSGRVNHETSAHDLAKTGSKTAHDGFERVPDSELVPYEEWHLDETHDHEGVNCEIDAPVVERLRPVSRNRDENRNQEWAQKTVGYCCFCGGTVSTTIQGLRGCLCWLRIRN